MRKCSPSHRMRRTTTSSKIRPPSALTAGQYSPLPLVDEVRACVSVAVEQRRRKSFYVHEVPPPDISGSSDALMPFKTRDASARRHSRCCLSPLSGVARRTELLPRRTSRFKYTMSSSSPELDPDIVSSRRQRSSVLNVM